MPRLHAKEHTEHRPCTGCVLAALFQSVYEAPLILYLPFALSKPPLNPGKDSIKGLTIHEVPLFRSWGQPLLTHSCARWATSGGSLSALS